MATNWITPATTSLAKVMSALVTGAQEANVGVGVQPGQTVNPNAELRSADALALQVTKIRQTIANALIVPISLTAGTVPPEAEEYCLVLTCRMSTGATPLMDQVVMQRGGSTSTFGSMVKEALEWLDKVSKGMLSPTYPTDPAPLAQLDANGDPIQTGVSWGDQYGTMKQYNGTSATPLPAFNNAPYDMSTDN